MVLKLYGGAHSPPTLRVAHILKEKNVPFDFVLVNVAEKQHKTPEYLQKQPFGQVPYIDDDGFILYETRAIGRYIALKYRDQGVPLIPDASDLRTTALFEQAASVEQNNFDPLALSIGLEKLYNAFIGKECNEELLAEHINKLAAKLDGYEAIMSKQKYLAGEVLTLADLFHVPFGTAITEAAGVKLLIDDEKRPNVARWWKDISSRPAWLAVKGGL
ncbi:glutathione S-transferase [Cytidiella melzeri]|nr:glutathione S-transferase [Cytidiella melzeri]